MAQLRSDIIIAMRADASGVDAARSALLGLQGTATKINATLGLLGAGLSGAALIGFAKRGVDFNSTLETAQTGIAALLRQFQPEKFETFSDAMRESARAVRLLREEAKTSPATFQQLLLAYQSTSGAMLRANIPLEKQVALISTMSQALSALGIRSEQIVQESRALITGNITEDAAAAKILGIRKADIEDAAKAGQLFEFLESKLASFSEAGAKSKDSFAVLASGLEDSLDDLAARFSKPLFDALKSSAGDLSRALGELSDDEIRDIATALADAAKAAGALARAFISIAPSVAPIAAALLAASLANRASDGASALAGFADARAARSGGSISDFRALDNGALLAASSLAKVAAASLHVASAFTAGFSAGDLINTLTRDATGKTLSAHIADAINGVDTPAEATRTTPEKTAAAASAEAFENARKQIDSFADTAAFARDSLEGLSESTESAKIREQLKGITLAEGDILSAVTGALGIREATLRSAAERPGSRSREDVERAATEAARLAPVRASLSAERERATSALVNRLDALKFDRLDASAQSTALAAELNKTIFEIPGLKGDDRLRSEIRALELQDRLAALAPKDAAALAPKELRATAAFTAADLAGDTARFGAFNFSPSTVAPGLPPGVQEEAKKTAAATEKSAALLGNIETILKNQRPGFSAL